MADNMDNMPPWLTPVEEMEDSVSQGIFEGNMKKVVVSVAILVIAIFVVAMWLMYDRPADNFEKPIEVLAAMDPIRVKPKKSGGKEILNQDKDVYKRLTGESDEKQPTSLASEAEMPLSKLPADKIKKEINKEAQLAEKYNKNKMEEPIIEAMVREKPAQPKAIPAAMLFNGKHKIQLGAYGAESGAAAYWKEIKAKMPTTFKGMREEFVPLTRNGRTLYRLRVGPVKDRAEADRLCLEIKAKQFACMVVDPK